MAISILIGAASHILWDSFTHHQGYFVNTISALSNTIDLLGRQVLLFKVLQHSSTLIGGLVVVFTIYKLPTNHRKKENVNPQYWIIFTGLTLAMVVVRFLSGLELKQYGNLIVTIISAGLISLTLAPLLTKRD